MSVSYVGDRASSTLSAPPGSDRLCAGGASLYAHSGAVYSTRFMAEHNVLLSASADKTGAELTVLSLTFNVDKTGAELTVLPLTFNVDKLVRS